MNNVKTYKTFGPEMVGKEINVLSADEPAQWERITAVAETLFVVRYSLTGDEVGWEFDQQEGWQIREPKKKVLYAQIRYFVYQSVTQPFPCVSEDLFSEEQVVRMGMHRYEWPYGKQEWREE